MENNLARIVVIKQLKFFLFFSLLFSGNVLKAQNLDEIKKQEVIFIYFDDIGEKFERTKSIFQAGGVIEYGNIYHFKFNENSRIKTISLIYNTYRDYDSFENGNRMLKFKINKSFVKKNKDFIISSRLIDKLKYVDFLELILGKQKVFIIDKEDSFKNLIIIKEVWIDWLREE